MMASGPIWADMFLSICAVIGLGVLHHVIGSRGAWTPLNRRFLFGIRVTLALFAARALFILTGLSLFSTAMLIAAALIPVAVLILTEGLLRRHAPRWAKMLTAGGAALFIVWALVPLGPDVWRVYGLMLLQVAGLSTCGWLVICRNKASLSGPENRAVERLGLSLIVLVPFVFVDFLTLQMGIPVQASPIAVLFLCWLAIGLGGSEARHRSSLFGFGVFVCAGLAAAGLLVFIWGMDRDAALVCYSVVLGAVSMAAVAQEARHLKVEDQSLSLLRHMAETDGNVLTFLRSLRDHPMVEGAAIIGADDVSDLDPEVLNAYFAKSPVLRASDPIPDATEGDYARHLFGRYGASHIFWVSGDPLRLVALAMPSVTASSQTELELAAVQKMAALMARTPNT